MQSTTTSFYGGTVTVEDVVSKGALGDYLGLINELIDHPYGGAALGVEKLYHNANFGDPEFLDEHRVRAAYHLVQALRQYPENAEEDRT